MVTKLQYLYLGSLPPSLGQIPAGREEEVSNPATLVDHCYFQCLNRVNIAKFNK